MSRYIRKPTEEKLTIITKFINPKQNFAQAKLGRIMMYKVFCRYGEATLSQCIMGGNHYLVWSLKMIYSECFCEISASLSSRAEVAPPGRAWFINTRKLKIIIWSSKDMEGKTQIHRVTRKSRKPEWELDILNVIYTCKCGAALKVFTFSCDYCT